MVLSHAITTRGIKEDEAKLIVNLIDEVILNYENDSVINSVRQKVNNLMSKKPLFDEN